MILQAIGQKGVSGSDCVDVQRAFQAVGIVPPCLDYDGDGYGVGAACKGEDCDDFDFQRSGTNCLRNDGSIDGGGSDSVSGAYGVYIRDTRVPEQPVVLDNSTGLMWQGCAAGLAGNDCATGTATTYNWQDALRYCDELDWGGYQDWILPKMDSLSSIVDESRKATGDDPTINVSAFPATPIFFPFWSSSSDASDPDFAWSVAFVDGEAYMIIKSDGYVWVRCVRAGP